MRKVPFFTLVAQNFYEAKKYYAFTSFSINNTKKRVKKKSTYIQKFDLQNRPNFMNFAKNSQFSQFSQNVA